MTIKVDARKVLEAFRRAPQQVERELRVEMKQQLEDLAVSAQTQHRFISRSGGAGLEGAITPAVGRSGLSGRVFLDTSLTGVLWRGLLLSYGVFVHEGHGSWRPDPFMTSALARKRAAIVKGLKDALQRAFKIAGLK